MSDNAPLSIGVAGLGDRGPQPRPQLRRAGCDASCAGAATGAPRSASASRASFPEARFTAELEDVLDLPGLDAVAIAASPKEHDPLRPPRARGRQALLRREAVHGLGRGGRGDRSPSAKNGPGSWSGTCSIPPGRQKLKEMVDAGELGDIHYIYGNRLNLGKLRADENALWSLGAHDVSVVLRLAGEEPHEVSARGESLHAQGRRGRRLRLPALPVRAGRAPAPPWLDPHKERRFTIVG